MNYCDIITAFDISEVDFVEVFYIKGRKTKLILSTSSKDSKLKKLLHSSVAYFTFSKHVLSVYFDYCEISSFCQEEVDVDEW